MSGIKGRSGRRPLPIALHLLRHTYRRDRHGPKPGPATARKTDIPPMPAALTAGLAERGITLAYNAWSLYDDWSEMDLALLREACQLVDQLEAFAAQIAADGCVVETGRGRGPHPLLRVQRQGRAQLVALLAALQLKEGE